MAVALRHPTKLFLLALVPAALRAAPIAAQLELVQPWTYRSPSGAVELFVDPSDRRGEGPASYRMSRGGENVWMLTLPYTLVDVLVLDDGTAGGYGYPGGVWWGKELVVAALNPDGGERWVVRESRDHRMPCSLPDATVYELQGCTEGFALDLDGRRSGRWLTFDWSTGKPLKKRLPLPAASAPAPSENEESPASPSIELALLGHVDFPWPPLPEAGDDRRSQAERRVREPHRVFVDALGRVWLSERSTRILHVFDESGHPLFECHPDPKTFRPYRHTEWIAVRHDGSSFLCADQGIEEFGPTGEHVRWTRTLDALEARWLFQPGGDARWSVSMSGEIVLTAADGRSSRILRGANGRWFQSLWVADVSPDGGLAVLDEPSGSGGRAPSTWVHLFSPRGEALRSLRVPDEFWGYTGANIAYDGRRIALLHNRSLLLLNENGSPIGRMTLPDELGEPSYLFYLFYVFFSPDGRELWGFPHSRPEMFRFALP